MYRQYENPYELERRLDELIERRILLKAMGLLSEDEEIDMAIDEADLRERINFAWQDDEFECDCYEY